ncbi:D(1)-like dopamine receptor [Synchiropus splendidus]|uniref:D(1)-like dopamine receptor n=1 Tax=Synchiropus splendidus TaxID=270530 RepID=UPI00237DC9B7|nr:D(1)-like dopamine receptor [Synchiropus splendidus]
MENHSVWVASSEVRSEGGGMSGGARALLGCVLSLLIVSTLLGNTLVCAAVVKFRHLRSKVTNSFVISLAVSDLLVAVLVMPWEAVTEVSGSWLLGRFCGVWIAFDIMCSTASILHLCIISVDRYWAIASPFRYERRMTQRVAFVMIGVAWTLSVLISFIPVQLNWHQAGEGQEVAEGGAAAKSCVANLNRTYAIASSLISFYIPVVIMIATYTRIYRIAQTQIRRIASLERAAEQNLPLDQAALKSSFRKETKVLKTLSVIMGVFVCCWLPFFVLNCTVPFCDPPCVSDTTFTVFVWFGWANSSLNPVIYAFNADFRRAFATILGCNRFCSSNAVEAVNFSNELVSYHHDTTLHREAPAPPPATRPQSERPTGAGAHFDQESVVSSVWRHRDRSARLQLEEDLEISWETITPFTSAAGFECETLIPGQVRHDN